MTLTGDDDGDGDEVEDSFHAAVLFVSSIGAAVLDRRDGKKAKQSRQRDTNKAGQEEDPSDSCRRRLDSVRNKQVPLSCFVLGLSKPCDTPLRLLRSSLCGEDHKLLESDCLDA